MGQIGHTLMTTLCSSSSSLVPIPPAAIMADSDNIQPPLFLGGSHIFDPSEFPPLRRVIPLPKRKRTIDDATLVHSPEAIPVAREHARTGEAQTTPDDLANALSTSMALNSYYMPLFHGSSDIFKDDIDPRHVNPSQLVSRTGGFANGYALPGEPCKDGDREEGGYMDHLSQPGNTKKRKVPVAAHARGADDTAQDAGEDLGDSAFPADRGVAEVVNVVPPVPPPLEMPPRKGNISRATLAGLHHKEMIKARKKQLAAVLGAFSHNDSLALDQALATSYPYGPRFQVRDGRYTDGLPVRLSRRPERRKARAVSAAKKKALPAPPINENARVPECAFSFLFDSPSEFCPGPTLFASVQSNECRVDPASERVRATSQEVAILQSRFDAEFTRQAVQAAEAAREVALIASQMQKAKRIERNQARARIAGQIAESNGSNPTQTNSEKAVATTKSKTKKKKRSALANASNPHHLRNYVPSRLPNSGPLHAAQATINTQNYLGPPPLRFLSAQLPSRKRSANVPPPTASLTNPEDEWICPFCEYNLFYGDEQNYRRAIRQRKKILSRRRRALERAASAAAGQRKDVVSPPKEGPAVGGDEVTETFEASSPEGQVSTTQNNGLRVEQDRDRDKGGERGRL